MDRRKPRLTIDQHKESFNPTAMAMAMAAEEDTAAVASILKDCFGHGGDFTVLVDEQVEGEAGSEVKQTVFKVWSPLLTRWSPVFDRMIHSEGFMEGHRARVVINDFSSKAVEAFLRFLYSGVVEGSLVDLVAGGTCPHGQVPGYKTPGAVHAGLPERHGTGECLPSLGLCRGALPAAGLAPTGVGNDMDQCQRGVDIMPEYKPRTAGGDSPAWASLHQQFRARGHEERLVLTRLLEKATG